MPVGQLSYLDTPGQKTPENAAKLLAAGVLLRGLGLSKCAYDMLALAYSWIWTEGEEERQILP